MMQTGYQKLSEFNFGLSSSILMYTLHENEIRLIKAKGHMSGFELLYMNGKGLSCGLSLSVAKAVFIQNVCVAYNVNVVEICNYYFSFVNIYIYSGTSLHRSHYLRFPAYIVCLIWYRN
jgi:hypothetical protein